MSTLKGIQQLRQWQNATGNPLINFARGTINFQAEQLINTPFAEGSQLCQTERLTLLMLSM
jgi:hypothetical protein